MSFQPVVPVGGIAGYRFVNETLERQLGLFARTPEVSRDLAAFAERAGGIDSVEALMADTRVLRVVLGAYGLEDDLPKRAFVRKVIEEGTLDREAFANRLADPAYRQMAEAVGFGDLAGRLGLSSVQEEIAERYRLRAFEAAVGLQNVDLRLALNFRREIAEVAASATAERSGWFRVLGSQPMRRVVETAFGLPQQFGLIDIDQQAAELSDRVRARYGGTGVAVFRDPAVVDDVIQRFLIISQAQGGGQPSAVQPASAAAQILSAGGFGPAAQAGLALSSLLR